MDFSDSDLTESDFSVDDIKELYEGQAVVISKPVHENGQNTVQTAKEEIEEDFPPMPTLKDLKAVSL